MVDAVGAELRDAATGAGVQVTPFSELEESGSKARREYRPPVPNDLMTICFTSGTAGDPKGAMLTHANFIAILSSVVHLWTNKLFTVLHSSDVHLSYLPLAHIYERLITSTMISCGARIGFYQGDPRKVLDDMLALRPTLFISVPRIFNRIYTKILAGVDALPPWKRALFHKACTKKLSNLEQRGQLHHWLYDLLIFRRIRATLGGRVRALVTGSAPISADIRRFLSVVLSVPFYEGYGLTESCAASCINALDDQTFGHVGVPLPCNELKLVDVPDLGYTGNDQPCPRGEVCFRGLNIFSGYYGQPELTRETIDADGWLHTGDIGRLNADGTLSIVDRKKSIFKLAQGEYVAPDRIQSVLANSPYIAQVFVHGDSLQSQLVAVVVPEEEPLMAWCKKNGVEGDFATVCKSEKVEALLLQSIAEVSRAKGLKGFETVRGIYISDQPMTVESGVLTPSLKIRRPQAGVRRRARFVTPAQRAAVTHHRRSVRAMLRRSVTSRRSSRRSTRSSIGPPCRKPERPLHCGVSSNHDGLAADNVVAPVDLARGDRGCRCVCLAGCLRHCPCPRRSRHVHRRSSPHSSRCPAGHSLGALLACRASL